MAQCDSDATATARSLLRQLTPPVATFFPGFLRSWPRATAAVHDGGRHGGGRRSITPPHHGAVEALSATRATLKQESTNPSIVAVVYCCL
uniref:Uncharacterized protein n=1 Tax=Oryza nivara TaxID=4536 RepID=A0A0E0IDF9_ORYNI